MALLATESDVALWADEVLDILQMLQFPIRIPTASWLFADAFQLIDSDVRRVLSFLKDDERITIDNGGWITIV